MKRHCRFVPLGQHPLVLVLCQIRFSPVGQMAEYSPAIQEDFRRHGYPIERSGAIQQLMITPTGVKVEDQTRWEYRRKDETWSVIVLRDSVVLQATSYGRFEDFADELLKALKSVFSKTEHDKYGVIHRVGLRYINLVQPKPGEDFRSYLREGLHGVADSVFQGGSQRVRIECAGMTKLAESEATMLVRVAQNDQGAELPLDLLETAPKRTPRAKPGELFTLIDMDHFIEGTFEPSADWVVARAYELHDHIIETFHDHVVTPHAIEAWK